MPKTTLRSGKSEAKVTIIRDSARVIILLRLTTDGHKTSLQQQRYLLPTPVSFEALAMGVPLGPRL